MSAPKTASTQNPSRIIVGITGSIAAYKAADLVSNLHKRGHETLVVMTQGAQQFITPLTLQTLSKNPVLTSIFDERESWRPQHIEFADNADLIIVAPATANIIAELAHGFANNALSEIALASLAPILIAPAMNGKMWQHVATQENVAKLKSRGAQFIGPEEGLLACGYEGLGRLWEIDGIIARAEEILAQRRG